MLARAASTAVARGTSSRALCVCLSAPRAVRAASSVAALSAAAARRAGRATAGDDAWQRTASAALSSKKGRRLDELGARVYFTTSARARRQEQSTTRTDSAESAAPAASESAQAATAPAAKEDKEVERGGAAEKVSLGELRRLGGLAWPERRTIGIALGLLTVSSSVSLAVPFAVGRIIDVFSGQAAPGLGALGPAAAAGVLAGIFAAGALANVGRTILMRLAGQRIVMRLRENAYANVLSLDMAWHDLQATQPAPVTTSAPTATTPTPPPSPKEEAQPAEKAKDDTDTRVRSTGDVLSRLGADSSIVGDALTRELGDGLRAVVTAVVGTGAMFLISAKLTLVALLIVPPLALAAVFYGRFIKRLARQTQRSVGDMVALADERLGAIRTVHAFNQTRAEHRRFAARTSRIFELARKEAYASGLFFGGAGFSGNVTLLALLSYGGMLVAGGELTVGALTSLLVYAFYIGSSLVSLSSFFGTLMKGLGASSRVFALLDARPVRVSLHSPGARTLETTRRGPGVLALENVTFRYPARAGAAPVLRDVSLRIEPGTSLAIAGASGSGKSTIAHLLARFYDPDQGRVTHDGEDIRDFTLESWRQQVAVIPQNPILFSGTIAENSACPS